MKTMRKRLTKSVRRGLLIWWSHCRSIMDDKEMEFNHEGDSEYTEDEMNSLQDALDWMWENSSSGEDERKE